jgi:phage anti-repressor protein
MGKGQAMLNTIKELQDIIRQQWVTGQQPTADEDSIGSTARGDFMDKDEFTGEIISMDTGDHVCWCEPSLPGKAMADMIIAAKELYKSMRIDRGDDYVIQGHIGDMFCKAFEKFVGRNAGW